MSNTAATVPTPLAVTASAAAATGERREGTAAGGHRRWGRAGRQRGVFLCARGGVMHDAKLQGCRGGGVAADIPWPALTANLTAG